MTGQKPPALLLFELSTIKNTFVRLFSVVHSFRARMEILVGAFENTTLVDHKLEIELGKFGPHRSDEFQVVGFSSAYVIRNYLVAGVALKNLIQLIQRIDIVDYGNIQFIFGEFYKFINKESAAHSNDIRPKKIGCADKSVYNIVIRNPIEIKDQIEFYSN